MSENEHTTLEMLIAAEITEDSPAAQAVHEGPSAGVNPDFYDTPRAQTFFKDRPVLSVVDEKKLGRPHGKLGEKATTIRQCVLELTTVFTTMTVRQVFYQLVSLRVVPKTENGGYRPVQEQVLKMRREGVLPWSFIADRTRWMRKPDSYDSVDDAIVSMHRTYRRNLWPDQNVRIEVWLEKDALARVVAPMTSACDIPLMVSRRTSSATSSTRPDKPLRTRGSVIRPRRSSTPSTTSTPPALAPQGRSRPAFENTEGTHQSRSSCSRSHPTRLTSGSYRPDRRRPRIQRRTSSGQRRRARRDPSGQTHRTRRRGGTSAHRRGRLEPRASLRGIRAVFPRRARRRQAR